MQSLRETGQRSNTSTAFRRFRSVAQFVRATCVFIRSKNEDRDLKESFDQTNDHALLVHTPLQNAFTCILKSSLLHSQLLFAFGGGASGQSHPVSARVSSITAAGVATGSLPPHYIGSIGSCDSAVDLDSVASKPILPRATAKRALELFEESMSITNFKRLPIAVSVVAFFNEFALGGIEEPDFAKAERLYDLAASMECTLAQARLAFLKMHGRPNIKINQSLAEHYRTLLSNLTKANASISTPLHSTSLSWLHIAASSGNSSAQFCLGLCHYNGIGTPKNNSAAYVFCHRAALQGHPGAMNMLGNLYTEGHGTPKTPTLGLRWYIRAAERKDAAAIYNIGTLFERGVAVDEDVRQAFEWYVRASVFGSVNAQNVLGIFYEQGVGVAQNPEKAVQYYKTAAGNGHPHAMYNLARCYHDGFGVERRDDVVALMWFKMASEQGHLLSILSVAVCFDAGIGVYGERSGAAARRNYWKACAKGSQEAKKRMAEVVAMEMLIAARPLLAGRMIHISELPSKSAIKQKTVQKVHSFTGAQPTPIRRLDPPRYLSRYDDATTELLSKLGLNSSYEIGGTSASTPSRSTTMSPSFSFSSYYASKSVDSMIYHKTVSPASSFTASSFLEREMARSRSQADLYRRRSFDSDDEVENESDAMDDSDDSEGCSDFEMEDTVIKTALVTSSKSTTTITQLPTEIILHILSFLNDYAVLRTSQVFSILKVAGDRTTLNAHMDMRNMFEMLDIERIAVWVDSKTWCRSCRSERTGSSCDKIKHYMSMVEVEGERN